MGMLEWLGIEGENPGTEGVTKEATPKSEYQHLSTPQLSQIMHILNRLQGASQK